MSDQAIQRKWQLIVSNGRLIDKTTIYIKNEIKQFYKKLFNNEETNIDVTINNVKLVFERWKQKVKFNPRPETEKRQIYLFITDLIKGTKYEETIKNEPGMERKTLIINDRMDLSYYKLSPNVENPSEIKNTQEGRFYEIANLEHYKQFWKTYKRPPSSFEFRVIHERMHILYSDEYRKTTGKEYIPPCFVKVQNEFLIKYYGKNWQDEYIVFDPCCGVGNLENDFPEQYIKNYCFMSTLDQTDVDRCKSKGFENVKVFDYLKDNSEPTFKYKGEELTIDEIAKKENKKIMIILGPPSQRVKGFKNNLAIEFYNKVCKLSPETIIFYYHTESFLRDEVENYINSKYKVVNHIMSSAKTTFSLSEKPISQVIFDKNKGTEINKEDIPVDRYELNKKTNELEYIKTYHYNNARPYLIKEIEKEIKKFQKEGQILGSWCYLYDVLVIGSLNKKSNNLITTENLKWCLLSKGINFNPNYPYYEWSRFVLRGTISEIKEELFNDAMMYALFYHSNMFTDKLIIKDKKNKNYIMPFTAEELGCNKNDLNVLELKDESERHEGWWDFREWFHKFKFSSEAQDLYNSVLEIFKYYHRTFTDTDFNDSWHDITNAIMGKTLDSCQKYIPAGDKKDTRINKTRTSKGTTSFSRVTIKKRVPPEYLPIFYNFFNKRNILAEKINKQLVESGLLLWERKNLYKKF